MIQTILDPTLPSFSLSPFVVTAVVGTLVASQLFEADLSIHHLESFHEKGWPKLVADSGLPVEEIEEHKKQFDETPEDSSLRGLHKSSVDPYGTKSSANQYFSTELSDADVDPAILSKKKRSRYTRHEHFQRALCRVYLVDYVCLRYALPPVCADLADEVDAYTANTLPYDIGTIKQKAINRLRDASRSHSVQRKSAHKGAKSSLMSEIVSLFQSPLTVEHNVTMSPSSSAPLSIVKAPPLPPSEQQSSSSSTTMIHGVPPSDPPTASSALSPNIFKIFLILTAMLCLLSFFLQKPNNKCSLQQASVTIS